MEDPVVAADGHIYERDAIVEWLENHDTSPVTRQVLEHKGLMAVQAVRANVLEFLQQCRLTGADPDELVDR